MGQPSAVFDLDRTLLKGASVRLLNRALRELDLRQRELPGEALLYRLNDRNLSEPVLSAPVENSESVRPLSSIVADPVALLHPPSVAVLVTPSGEGAGAGPVPGASPSEEP